MTEAVDVPSCEMGANGHEQYQYRQGKYDTNCFSYLCGFHNGFSLRFITLFVDVDDDPFSFQ